MGQVLKLSKLSVRFVEVVNNWKSELAPRAHMEKPHGVYFHCPRCQPVHAIVQLFDMPEVAPNVQPHGRLKAINTSLERLTVRGEIESPTRCGWKGHIRNGCVYFD